jgi:hypothetical protein
MTRSFLLENGLQYPIAGQPQHLDAINPSDSNMIPVYHQDKSYLVSSKQEIQALDGHRKIAHASLKMLLVATELHNVILIASNNNKYTHRDKPTEMRSFS